MTTELKDKVLADVMNTKFLINYLQIKNYQPDSIALRFSFLDNFCFAELNKICNNHGCRYYLDNPTSWMHQIIIRPNHA